ncbi:hypothetical protein Clacol_009364 [Clathrus columnatus]|uniref:Uncharacterized protein n=1 Tax=Clathrus columnatus TaxID=1419009 RepID=A0AAV5AKD9_9AGAM|nr:hypothetical protein Clacol_009364 [Clathrus columnatus]
MSADNSFKTGTNIKDPVATAYAGKNPADVEWSKQGNKTIEATPASTALRDPATGDIKVHPVTMDERTIPTQDLVADESEIDTITTSAGDTLGGATSQDVVNRGLAGAPAQGETSAELHHDGHSHAKAQRQGKVQYGAQGGSLHLGQTDKPRPEN